MAILPLSFVNGKWIQRGFIMKLVQVDYGLENVIVAVAREYLLKSCL